MRWSAPLLLALLWLAPALAAPETGAAGLLGQVREKGRPVTRFEADVRVARADLRFLESFYPPGPSGAPIHLEGPMACTPEGGFALWLRQAGARYYWFQSRQGTVVRYGGLVRLGEGSAAVAEPEAGASPSPADLGFEDFTPDTAVPLASHPLLFLWPYELRPPLPGEEVAPEVGRENMFGQPAYRVALEASGGLSQTLWIDRKTLQVLRLQASRAGGPLMQADYRYGKAPEPAWTEVEVSTGHRPLYVARLVNPAVNPASSRIPGDVLVLSRPGGERVADKGEGFSWSRLPAWQQSVLGTLALILGYLALRFVWFQFRRQEYSRELILVDREAGPWEFRLKRLGFPCVPFSPELLTKELQGLGRRATADSRRPPRAVLVAANGCATIPKHTYLLRSYVEEGGRVLLLEHSEASWRHLPFPATRVEVPEALLQTVYSDPEGPWSRVNFEEAGHFAAALGSGAYYADLEGAPVDWEVVAVAGPGGEPKGVALGVARRGRGEWILCQISLPASAMARKSVGERFLRDLLDYVQGRKLWFPELHDE